MKKIAVLFICTFLVHSGISQNCIDGRFNLKTQTFETTATDYWIDFFENGIARISRNGYVGLMDSTGHILIEPRYDKVFAFEGEVAKTGFNGKLGLINKKGHVLAEPFTYQMGPFNEGIAIYRNQSWWLYGMVTSTGKLITKAEYNYLSPLKERRITFVRDSTVGLLTSEGKEIILVKDYNPSNPDNVIYNGADGYLLKSGTHYCRLFEFNDGLAVSFQKEGKKYKFGYIDSIGTVVIRAQFDWAEKFVNGYAKVCNNGKWGVIDKRGNTVIPISYNHVSEIIENNRFIVYSNNKYGLVGIGGKVLMPFTYSGLYYLSDDLFAAQNEKPGEGKNKHDLFTAKNDKLWGVIDAKGKEILPFTYDAISSGIALWNVGCEPLNTGVPRYIYHGKYFYFDKNGRADTNEYTFSHLIEGISDWYVPGTINPKIFFIWQKRYGVADNNSSSGTREHPSLPSDTYVSKNLKGGYRIVYKTEKNSTQPVDRNTISDLPFRKRWPYYQEHNYKTGIIDAEGRQIVPPIYDNIKDVGKNIFAVQKGKKCGVININNEVIVPVKFESIDILAGGIVAYKDTTDYENYSVYDLSGNILIAPQKFRISETNTGTWVISTSDQSFYIDKTGDVINR